ncbi:MAG TPA: ABC transporter ATP-binding protein [Acidimicrobiales bacterium]|nr:ABC transporter ATP-binding protein [Acidimicrobiales bacterium]
MATTSTLRLARSSRLSSRSDRARKWQVVIDGTLVGSIPNQRTVEFPVEPGEHRVQVKSTKYLYSPEVTFEASAGTVTPFVCHPRSLSPFIATRWLVWLLISLVQHELWIELKFDDSNASGTDVTRAVAARSASQRETQSISTPVRPQVSFSPRPVETNTSAAVRRSVDTRHALVVNNLTKRFGERTAFSDVSFDVGYGEVFGFLGPNGAGKTTTVRTLGTLIAPTSGSATVAGIPLKPENGVEIRQHIAIMPESPGLYLRLTVTENLEYFAGLYGQRHAAQRIKDALEAVNLSDRASDLCGGLSKGLRQRVGLARTLLSDPAILFLDEPTSGLDPVASLEVHNLIIGLREKGVTIFLTTHRLDEAEKLCDRVAFLNTTLRSVGRTAELRDQLFKRSLVVKTLAPLRDPETLFSRVLAVEEWRADGASSYVLTVSDPDIAAPDVTRNLVGDGADVLFIGESQHSLEDVYLELIDDDVEAHRP